MSARQHPSAVKGLLALLVMLLPIGLLLYAWVFIEDKDAPKPSNEVHGPIGQEAAWPDPTQLTPDQEEDIQRKAQAMDDLVRSTREPSDSSQDPAARQELRQPPGQQQP